jgi:hypothetical protein
LLGYNPSGIWRALNIRGVEMRPQGFPEKATSTRLTRSLLDQRHT